MGLYACNVRRLRIEKRKPANFLALAAVSIVVIASLVSLLLWVMLLGAFPLLGCVVGGSLSLSEI